MYNMIVTTLLPLLAIAQLGFAQGICGADNCLRAVRNTQPAFSGRGTADCSSYFRATVTPRTVTFTATSYITSTPSAVTLTQSNTLTITPPTITSVTSVVQTSTPDPRTTVVTDTSSITTSTTVTRAAIKRQVTASPSNIPSYASVCSGAVRYSSACSCIGVTRTTTIVAAPSTTTTVRITLTATPSSVTVTNSQTTTLPTQTTLVTNLSTFTLSPSTATVTTTQTEISTVTSTAIPAAATCVGSVEATCPEPSFYITVIGKTSLPFAAISFIFTSDQTISATSSMSAASKFKINSQGQLVVTDPTGRDSVVYYQNGFNFPDFRPWNVPSLGASTSSLMPVMVQLGEGGSACPSTIPGTSGKIYLAGCTSSTFVGFGTCNNFIYSSRNGGTNGCNSGPNVAMNVELGYTVV
ncbi:hypothetical protein VTL71DRAFT_6586 [Oculimacula yallundae]|uniref:Uncharacterized protein n=1 Tax=Oculimacula yallundae TaxID=86028 RepID=A0ABR4BXC3_9HELO